MFDHIGKNISSFKVKKTNLSPWMTGKESQSTIVIDHLRFIKRQVMCFTHAACENHEFLKEMGKNSQDNMIRWPTNLCNVIW